MGRDGQALNIGALLPGIGLRPLAGLGPCAGPLALVRTCFVRVSVCAAPKTN